MGNRAGGITALNFFRPLKTFGLCHKLLHPSPMTVLSYVVEFYHNSGYDKTNAGASLKFPGNFIWLKIAPTFKTFMKLMPLLNCYGKRLYKGQ